MSPVNLLIAIAVLAVIWHMVATMLIFDALKKRGMNPSFLWLRLYVLKYAHQYKVLTRQETGKTGPLFWRWLISINIALVAAIAGALTSN